MYIHMALKKMVILFSLEKKIVKPLLCKVLLMYTIYVYLMIPHSYTVPLYFTIAISAMYMIQVYTIITCKSLYVYYKLLLISGAIFIILTSSSSTGYLSVYSL